MRQLLGFILLFVFTNSLSQQTIGIGTNTPNQNAILDVYDTAKGVLLPRISKEKRLQLPNVRGMVVYDTTTANYWWNDGVAWVNIPGRGAQLGEMIYWDGTKWSRIPIGYGGQVLTLDPDSLIPRWSGPSIPFVTTTPISNISVTLAQIGGEVSGEGGSPVTERGIVWGTATNPNVQNSNKALFGSGIGTFSGTLTGLSANTTYFARAYAINSRGAAYGQEYSFQTLLVDVPSIASSTVSNVNAPETYILSNIFFVATANSSIISDNGSPITEKGFCWSTSPNPVISGYQKTVFLGPGSGSFSSTNIGYLSPQTTYYLRPFAINSTGVAYGEQISFFTAAQTPIVSTGDTLNITSSSVTIKGQISDRRGGSISEKGVAWGLSPSPTIANNKTLSSNAGDFSINSDVVGLAPNTTYYFRAYATNVAGTGYGSEVSIRTRSTTPTITTTQLSNVGTTSANSGGNVTSDGGQTVTARGIVWSTSPGPITALTTKTVNGSGTGSFSAAMTGLSPNTVYYVRSYATNALGTSYGNELSFTTAQ